jgi:hypothetical protein
MRPRIDSAVNENTMSVGTLHSIPRSSHMSSPSLFLTLYQRLYNRKDKALQPAVHQNWTQGLLPTALFSTSLLNTPQSA